MQFNSIDFMVFFPLAAAVYFLVPRKGRMPWLLAALGVPAGEAGAWLVSGGEVLWASGPPQEGTSSPPRAFPLPRGGREKRDKGRAAPSRLTAEGACFTFWCR